MTKKNWNRFPITYSNYSQFLNEKPWTISTHAFYSHNFLSISLAIAIIRNAIVCCEISDERQLKIFHNCQMLEELLNKQRGTRILCAYICDAIYIHESNWECFSQRPRVRNAITFFESGCSTQTKKKFLPIDYPFGKLQILIQTSFSTRFIDS